MGVHGLDHARVHRHALGLVGLVLCTQSTPITGGCHSDHGHVGGNDAQGGGPLPALLAQFVPTLLISVGIVVDVLLGRLHGHVHRHKRQVSEERGGLVAVRPDELHQFVDQEFRRVKICWQSEALAVGKPVRPVVQGQVGPLLPIVGAGIHHGHGALKPPGYRSFFRGHTQMPFTRHVGSVAGVLEQRGHGYHVVAQHALIMGVDPLLWRNQFRDIRHPGQVTIDPGQQHGPRWGTVGRRMVIAEADALVRQGIQGRRVDLAAVGRQIGKTQIIGQDQHDIGARSLAGVMCN